MSGHLSELGRQEEALAKAEQAEALYCELAERQPDAYRDDWCLSLGNLGVRLDKLGRYEEALARAKQGEAIRRELAERQPEAYRANWALALGNLAEISVHGGLAGEALPAAERAVALLDALAVYPNAHRDHLGFCLRVLAEALLGTGDVYRALEEAQRGHRIWATVFAERPAYACEQYGKSLPVLARAHLAVGGKDPAVATLRHGIESMTPFFQQRPAALRGAMDGLIRTLREIDPVAATELIPSSLAEQLEEFARRADSRPASPMVDRKT